MLVFLITVRHRTISIETSERNQKWSEKMSCAKRKTISSDFTPAKRGVTIKWVNKWIAENDKQLTIMIWLCYKKADREYMLVLKCSICIQFQEKLLSQKNYNSAFISGPKNLWTSSFMDHTDNWMHKHAMILYKKSQAGEDAAAYAPITKALSVTNTRNAETMKFHTFFVKKTYTEWHKTEIMESVFENCIRGHHPELLTNVLTALQHRVGINLKRLILQLQSWMMLRCRFLRLLEAAGVDIANINE